MKLVIRGGHVIDPASGWDAPGDVAIERGRIKDLAGSIDSSGVEVFDASGMIVAPGFIDMHVHLRDPGFEHAETIETGSRAAAAGGFTSVCCMPNTNPINDSATVTSYIVERARKFGCVNVYPIGAITKGSLGEELSSIGSMKRAGVIAISDDGRPVMNARIMRRAMEAARSFDLPVIDHCEDLNLSAGGDMHEGLPSVRFGIRGIPAASEDVMVARDILLAELTGARFHVAHLSTRRSVAMVAHAKKMGLAVSAEATPHHLTLCDTDVLPYDSHYKMKPPLRANDDVQAVLDGLVSGAIDVLATDHAPHPGSEKMQEFEKCPFGITGLETAIPLSLNALVHTGRIGLRKLVELYTVNPARILKLPKGTLARGADADITIFDPNLVWRYDVDKGYSRSRNSPFDGRDLRGAAMATIVGGKIAWQRQG